MSSQPSGFGESEPVETDYSRYHTHPGPEPFKCCSANDESVASATRLCADATESLLRWEECFGEALKRFLILPASAHSIPRTVNATDDDSEKAKSRQHWLAVQRQLIDQAVIHAFHSVKQGYGGCHDLDGKPIPAVVVNRVIDVWSPHDDTSSPSVGDFYRWRDTGHFTPTTTYVVGVPNDDDEQRRTDWIHAARQRGTELSALYRELRAKDRRGNWFSPEYRDPQRLHAEAAEHEILDSMYHVQIRFASHAAASECLSQWQDPNWLAVFRYYYDSGSGARALHEGYLAGIRLWIDRVVAAKFRCECKRDFRELRSLFKVVVERSKVAYRPQGPLSFLGFDDSYVCRLIYPLLFDRPAESRVDVATIRATRRGADGDDYRSVGLAELVAEHRFGQLSRWFQGITETPPRMWDSMKELRSLGERLRNRVGVEVSRFGISDQADAIVLKSPVDDLAVIGWMIDDVLRSERVSSVEGDGDVSMPNAEPMTTTNARPSTKPTQADDEPSLSTQSEGVALLRGVSLLDIALLLSDGDDAAAKVTRKRWQNSRNPVLPDSIGDDSEDRRVKLYAPSAIFEFVEIVEGRSKTEIAEFLKRIRHRVRPIRFVKIV